MSFLNKFFTDNVTLYNVCAVPLGVFSTVGDIMSTVGIILSTVGDVQYRGGISWCTWGISWVPWRVFSTMGGGKSFVIWVPHGTEHPHGTYDIPPHVSWYPLGTQISKDGIPHGTEHPPRYSWYPPRYWTSPTVLKITPHGTQDIPHNTEHPHGTQDISPHLSWYPPTVLKISPTVLMISPTVLNTPTALHTHYTGWVWDLCISHFQAWPSTGQNPQAIFW